jgi:hypothetical protein
MSAPRRSDQAYVEQLGSVLRAQDPARLREFLMNSAREFGDAEQVARVEQQFAREIETLMHHMILARPDLVDLHRASEVWLDEAGHPLGPTPGGDRSRQRPKQPTPPRKRPTPGNRGPR